MKKLLTLALGLLLIPSVSPAAALTVTIEWSFNAWFIVASSAPIPGDVGGTTLGSRLVPLKEKVSVLLAALAPDPLSTQGVQYQCQGKLFHFDFTQFGPAAAVTSLKNCELVP